MYPGPIDTLPKLNRGKCYIGPDFIVAQGIET